MGKAKLITYDLIKPETDYLDLIAEIKKYSDWCKIQKSVWIVSTNDNCITIRDHLKSNMDDDDRLFVAALSGETAWIKSICKDEEAKRVITA